MIEGEWVDSGRLVKASKACRGRPVMQGRNLQSDGLAFKDPILMDSYASDLNCNSACASSAVTEVVWAAIIKGSVPNFSSSWQALHRPL